MKGVLYVVLVSLVVLMGLKEGRLLFGCPWGEVVGGLMGMLAAGIGIGAARALARFPLGAFLGAFGGFSLFWVTGKLIEGLLPLEVGSFLFLCLLVVGVIVGAKKGGEVGMLLRRTEGTAVPKVLDTSAIIDGRIADICETGFLEGTILVPQFVLKELQYIADTPDPVRRARGRRGLDVLDRLQRGAKVPVRIIEEDFLEIKEVDQKLIELARRKGAKIVTTDYNLNKVAKLHGIEVLNVNELVNALRPVVLPGETLKVQVIREGKEPDQGVGYLEDGTMVVVEDGKKSIGQEVEITVTSVLQTPSGRIIFGREKGS